MENTITVSVTINSSIDKVWDCFTQSEHITKWNFASADWHCPIANITFKEFGSFAYRMESTDGKQGFMFEGFFTQIVPHTEIHYQIADGRQAKVLFKETEDGVEVTEVFEPEHVNPLDLQQKGWQAILDSFKAHVESLP